MISICRKSVMPQQNLFYVAEHFFVNFWQNRKEWYWSSILQLCWIGGFWYRVDTTDFLLVWKLFFYQVVDNVSQKRNTVFSNRLNGQGWNVNIPSGTVVLHIFQTFSTSLYVAVRNMKLSVIFLLDLLDYFSLVFE